MSTSRKKTSLKFFGKQTSVKKSWLELENEENASSPSIRKIMQLFWEKRIVQHNKNSVDEFKDFLKGSIPGELEKNKIENLFNDAIAGNIQFEEFAQTIENLGPKYIYAMNGAEKLVPIIEKDIQDLARPLFDDDILSLQQYMQDKNISASVSLRANDSNLITPNFPENESKAIFAMHSVGKVFTAMLVFSLIRDGIIAEKDLHRPIELPLEIEDQLPHSVRDRLKNVTLHQLMTHHAGVGDYLTKYIDDIKQDKVPNIKKVEDFIPFIEDKIFPINQFKYSNAGILLVGLATKYIFEKKTGIKVDYYDLLKQYILDDAGITSFSPWRPNNAKTNPIDKIAPHIVGSPGGGYWISSADLAKFGQWIYESCKADPKLKRLVQKYGQEFYNRDRELIAHGGAIPSSSAYLSVSLKTGAVIAILSDQPDNAFVLHTRIQKNVIDDKGVDITDKEMAQSDFGQSSHTAKEAVKSMQPLIKKILDDVNIPALSMSWHQAKANVSKKFAIGVTDTSNPKPVDDATLFQASSLSKPMSAAMVLDLVEQHRWDLDTPLAKFADYGPPDLKTDPRYQELTIRMVLGQCSGLPNVANADSEKKFMVTPGLQFDYSGLAFDFLKEVIEKKLQKSWETLAQEFFAKIGMQNSTFKQLPASHLHGKHDIAHGHQADGTPGQLTFPLDLIDPAGSLLTTANDFMIFLQYCYNNKSLKDTLLTPAYKLNKDFPEISADQIQWGLGMGVYTDQEKTIAFHWGNNKGWSSFCGINTKTGDAIVCLVNSDNRVVIKPLTESVLGDMAPLFRWLSLCDFKTEKTPNTPHSITRLFPLVNALTEKSMLPSVSYESIFSQPPKESPIQTDKQGETIQVHRRRGG